MGWDDYFENRILKRGHDYYRDGYIDSLNKNGDIIKARVIGTRAYHIHIDLNHLEDMECTCPYFETAYCKHLAAVLYANEKDDYENNEEYDDIYEDYDDEYSVDRQDCVKDLLNEANNQQIKDFMTNLLKEDNLLKLKFKSYISKDLNHYNIKEYKKIIQNILDRYLEYQNYIDGGDAFYLYEEINNIYNQFMPLSMKAKQYQEVFNFTAFLYQKLSYIEGEYCNSYIDTLRTECLSTFKNILNQEISSLLKEDILKWFFKEIDENLLTHDLETIVFDSFKEEQFLNLKLIYIHKIINRIKNSNHNHQFEYNKWLSYYLDVLYELNKPNAQLEKFYTQYWHHNIIRKRVINDYLVNKEYNQAIVILKESQLLDNDQTHYCIEHSYKLINIYKILNDIYALKEELWRLLTFYKESSIDTYKDLKSLYTAHDFQDKHDTIVSLYRYNYIFLQEIYLEDQNYGNLINSITNIPGLNCLYKYEEILKPLYEKQLLEKYKIELYAIAKTSSKRSGYQKLIPILLKLKSYKTGQETLQDIIQNLKILYKHKSAMMDELSKIKI